MGLVVSIDAQIEEGVDEICDRWLENWSRQIDAAKDLQDVRSRSGEVGKVLWVILA